MRSSIFLHHPTIVLHFPGDYDTKYRLCPARSRRATIIGAMLGIRSAYGSETSPVIVEGKHALRMEQKIIGTMGAWSYDLRRSEER